MNLKTMKLVAYYLIVVQLFTLLWPAAAIAQSACSGVLLQSLQPFENAEMKTHLLADSGHEEIMRFAGPFYSHIGKLRTIESLNGDWDSGYVGNGSDPMGSPLYFPAIVGGKIAAQFGFSKISKNLISVPTVSVLNQRIDSVNQALAARSQAPLVMRFYETNFRKPLSDKDYLKNFVEGGLPLEKEGALGIHDLSYHTVSAILPQAFYQRLQLNVAWVLKFADFLETLKVPALKPEIHGLLKEAAIHVDLSGNLAPYLTYEKISPELIGDSFHLSSILKLTGAHLSPHIFLQTLLEKHPKLHFEFLKFLSTDSGYALLSEQRSISAEELTTALRNGIQTNIKNLNNLTKNPN